jgi:serine phosphatase RsbU (regulator of sigma subunit)
MPVGEAGSLVGVLDVVDTRDHVVALRPGDVLVLYTDGVTEGRRGREFFGDERLRGSVARHAGSPLPAESILADVLDFQEGSAGDDIAVVAVRLPATSIHQQVREEFPS